MIQSYINNICMHNSSSRDNIKKYNYDVLDIIKLVKNKIKCHSAISQFTM